MASLQAYTSHGQHYYRIVESYRQNGKPRLRVLAHLGKVEDILQLIQGQTRSLKVRSFMVGAVTALYGVAGELGVAEKINQELRRRGRRVQSRDGLSVGETLLAGMIGRACAPRSKRAFADWAGTTGLPELMGFESGKLTSQHFWDQMQAVPVTALASMEEAIVKEMVRIEQLELEASLYDTTNFYTYIATRNRRAELPERGHNKQRRHDLRQLGLALVVDQQTQLPLFHHLYAGARSDVRVLAQLLKPIRRRLRRLQAPAQQLTLVFDGGANSQGNLEAAEATRLHYVAALRPSGHRPWLAEIADQLREVSLSDGTPVRAYRTRRTISGAEREVVVVFSEQLYQGQLCGLDQQLEKSARELAILGTWSRYRPETIQQRLKKLCGRQYIRGLIRYALEPDPEGGTRLRIWSEVEEYRRLTTRYFGLRILVTDQRHWSTAKIIETYRGQSKAESSFRDLKNPGMLATRPQFHWTDQKLYVHTFMCVTAYLLVRLLWWRTRPQFPGIGSAQNLLAQLKKVRLSRVVQLTGKAGRPRLTYQVEEMDTELQKLAEITHALPHFG